MKKREFKISFFLHVWEKKAEEISLEEFHNDLRGARWKVLAESYRRWMRTGMTEEGKRLKGALNAVVVAGKCRGGHAANQVTELNGLALFDFDHCLEMLAGMKEKAGALPYVVGAFVSISGEGLKLIVCIDAENAGQYAVAYPVVARELERVLGHPCDMSCRDLGRACYASYDPEAYYNPGAGVFPWREQVDGLLQAEGECSEQSVGKACPAGVASETGDGFMQAFLNDFDARNPFVAGGRHAFVLKLGRVARYKGFSPKEMRLLQKAVVEKYAQADFGSGEIEKTLSSGYQYVSARRADAMTTDLGPKVQGPFYGMPEEEEEEDLEDILFGKSEGFRRSAPYFPDEVFEHLPALLAEGVRVAGSSRERDMLLAAMIVNISACLPEVRLLYDQMYYSPHLYYMVIAHAGGGKGVVGLAGMLPAEIHKFYEKQNDEVRLVYDKAFFEWELEQKKAQAEKRSPDFALRPREPLRKLLMLSPNVSKSLIISALEESGKLGCCINATELDMVSGAIRNECGKHDDVFRAAFQHEVVSADFKVNGRQVVARHLRLALCLAGTPNQLVRFIPSLENGLYSRFLIYTGQSAWEWRSAAPRAGCEDHRAVFARLSARLLELHQFLLQSPTEVTFTPGQWEEHTLRFASHLSEVVNERDDSPGAIVLRHGLMASRIACVLTALRKGECAWAMPEYACSDEDFHTAMLMTDVLLEHSLLLSTCMQKSESKPKPLKPYFRLRPVLQVLSGTFTFTQVVDKAVEMGIPKTTAKRLFRKTVELKLVVKEGDVYRKTTRSWGAGIP
ncbi:DUF3987 domain-containing protein [Bacteroides fragilis]